MEVFPPSPDIPGALTTYHDSLGHGLLAKGDTAAAIAEFRRAVDIGTRTKHPVTSHSQDKLRQLEKITAQAGKTNP
jgi:hypothetical protein